MEKPLATAVKKAIFVGHGETGLSTISITLTFIFISTKSTFSIGLEEPE